MEPRKRNNKINIPKIQKIQVKTKVREKMDIGFFSYYIFSNNLLINNATNNLTFNNKGN
jgi:hypothetical protein